MELHDSIRYQEAVIRLKRLLCDDPHSSSFHTDERHNGYTSTHISRSYKKEWEKDEGNVSRESVGTPSLGIDGDPGRTLKKFRNPPDGAWGLLELLHHQEELIGQLEKENEFLKREIVSVSDDAKKIAQDNQDLSRRLAKALSEALAQDETSENISSASDSQAGKVPESTTKLEKEKANLAAEVERLQSVLDATTEREQQALDKLRKALAIAEDTQAFTAQVRSSSEAAIENLSSLLTATKGESEELKRLLEKADTKATDLEEEQDQWRSQQQQRIKHLENEISDQSTIIAKLESEIREKGRKVIVLQDDLQAAQAAKARMEAQLEEQRQHAKDAHARLDNLLMSRCTEAAVATTRASELEERLTSARQDVNRLLQTISSIAQGAGKIRDLESTDDVKTERLAAEQQLNDLLSSLQNKHEEEVKTLQEATVQHQRSMDVLREEIAGLRLQVAEDNEKHRLCLQKMDQTLSSLTATGKIDEGEEKGYSESEVSGLVLDGDDDSGLVSAHSARNDESGGNAQDSIPEKDSDNAKPWPEKDSDIAKPSPEKVSDINPLPETDNSGLSTDENSKTNPGKTTDDKPIAVDSNSQEINPDTNEKTIPSVVVNAPSPVPSGESESTNSQKNDKQASKDLPLVPESKDQQNNDKNKSEKLALDMASSDPKDIDDKSDPSKPDSTESVISEGKENGNDIAESKSFTTCEACKGWSVFVDVVGEALEGLQVDLAKQETRLDRTISTCGTQCDNCLKYQLFLGVTSYKLNNLHKYSYVLGKRIDSLTSRIKSL